MSGHAYPPPNATRPTIRRYYQNTQDTSLAAFLASRNRHTASQPQPPTPGTSRSANQEDTDPCQDGPRRVRRRIGQDLDTARGQDDDFVSDIPVSCISAYFLFRIP